MKGKKQPHDIGLAVGEVVLGTELESSNTWREDCTLRTRTTLHSTAVQLTSSDRGSPGTRFLLQPYCVIASPKDLV